MKKLIRISQLIAIILFSLSSYSQVTVAIQSLEYINNGQPTVTPPNCGTIDLGTSSTTSINFGINLSKPNGQSVGLGNLYVYTEKVPSGNRVERSWTLVQEVSWNHPSSGNDTYGSTVAFSISSSDFNVSGGKLYVIFKSSGGVEYKSCEYPIVKAQVPTFTLSPATVSVSCGSTSPVTFTATNVYNSPNATYNWSYSGWTLISSTSNSVTLKPSSLTSLPSSVILYPSSNGVSYQYSNCLVSRAAFNSSATIAGANSICIPATSGSYSIVNLLSGQTVSWSSSNTAIGTVSGTGNTVTVNKVANGSFYLRATITNACGQQAIVTKSIRFGGIPSSLSVSSLATGGSYDLTLTWPPAITQGLTSVTWTKVSGNGTCGGSGLTGWADGSPNIPWTVTIKVTATNDCGSVDTFATYEGYGYGGSCDKKIEIVKSDIKNNFSARIIDPCKTSDTMPAKDQEIKAQEIVSAKVYDISGKFIKEFKTNNFDLSDCKKGIYVINVVDYQNAYTTKVIVD